MSELYDQDEELEDAYLNTWLDEMVLERNETLKNIWFALAVIAFLLAALLGVEFGKVI